MRASAGVADAATEDIWNNIKTDLLRRCVAHLCPTTGVVKPGGEHVEKAIATKRKALKAWKTGKGTRA